MSQVGTGDTAVTVAHKGAQRDLAREPAAGRSSGDAIDARPRSYPAVPRLAIRQYFGRTARGDLA